MSAGMMILTVVAVLVFCGVLQRVLDRMYLTDREALFIVGAMLLGGLLPDLVIGPVRVNVGGAVIPLGVCAWLLYRADTALERWRSLLCSLLTGGAVYLLSRLLPAEAEALPVEPMLLYGLSGGLIAWIAGRSRRCAFISGVAGVLIADTLSALIAWTQGSPVQLILGGAGIADAAVISGVGAVLLCEMTGEAAERIMRRAGRGGNRV